MKTRLRISKKAIPIYDGLHNIVDAESFGDACKAAWAAIAKKEFAGVTSIVSCRLESDGVDLDGTEMQLSKVPEQGSAYRCEV